MTTTGIRRSRKPWTRPTDCVVCWNNGKWCPGLWLKVDVTEGWYPCSQSLFQVATSWRIFLQHALCPLSDAMHVMSTLPEMAHTKRPPAKQKPLTWARHQNTHFAHKKQTTALQHNPLPKPPLHEVPRCCKQTATWPTIEWREGAMADAYRLQSCLLTVWSKAFRKRGQCGFPVVGRAIYCSMRGRMGPVLAAASRSVELPEPFHPDPLPFLHREIWPADDHSGTTSPLFLKVASVSFF